MPLEPSPWQAIIERAPAELHLIGKTVRTAAALAAGQDLAVALASAVRVAGVRVVHRGPWGWFKTL